MAFTLVWCVNKYSGKILLLRSYVEITCKIFPTKKKLVSFCQAFSRNISGVNEDFFYFQKQLFGDALQDGPS